MNLRRTLAAAILALITLGSLTFTAGAAWYLRSATYREFCAGRLSSELGLPAEIGQVVPRSSRSREFRNVVVWLPEKRDEAHTVDRAILSLTPEPGNPDAYELDLRGGKSDISTRTWLRSDYRGLLESGLRPGFSPDGPRRVRFSQMALSFERESFKAELRDAAGYVAFDSQSEGNVVISCQMFNGHAVEEPVVLTARFSARDSGVRVDELKLRVPNIPLRVARLDDLVGVNVTHGRFRGELTYSESDEGKRGVISGDLYDIDLTECTAGLLANPVRGICAEMHVGEFTIVNRVPLSGSIRGRITQLRIGDLLSLLGMDSIDGVASLDLDVARVSREGIERLVAGGECDRLPLESISAAFGLGKIGGTARLEIQDLNIENNRLRSLKATIVAHESDDADRWVEGELLRTLVSKALKVELPAILPERIEYTKLGVRLEVRDEVLYVFGTHGPRDGTIMTARMFGRDIPLIPEPRESIDLEPWLSQLRARATHRLRERLGSPAATTP
ncbi:MAG: hypothetical protein ACKVS9_04280 [Phycisphaerae bacterium]